MHLVVGARRGSFACKPNREPSKEVPQLRSYWREIVVMLLCGFIGLGLPDIDLAVLPILHHRSIVTHSVLVPILALSIANMPARFGACGFVLGISIHLSADILSPARGFGMVWLPWPIKYPLGPFSPLWLAANAFVGLVWVKVLLARLDSRAPHLAFVAGALILAPLYALVHENKILPLVVFSAIFAASHFAAARVSQMPWFRVLTPKKLR
jgi:hypothetical protein